MNRDNIDWSRVKSAKFDDNGLVTEVDFWPPRNQFTPTYTSMPEPVSMPPIDSASEKLRAQSELLDRLKENSKITDEDILMDPMAGIKEDHLDGF